MGAQRRYGSFNALIVLRELKLNAVCVFSSLIIGVEGLPKTTVIHTGQHILIEGDDEENPYVAKVIELFGKKPRDNLQLHS